MVSRCTSILTEALIFLKANELYWEQALVCETITERRFNAFTTKLTAQQEKEDLLGGIEHHQVAYLVKHNSIEKLYG